MRSVPPYAHYPRKMRVSAAPTASARDHGDCAQTHSATHSAVSSATASPEAVVHLLRQVVEAATVLLGLAVFGGLAFFFLVLA